MKLRILLALIAFLYQPCILLADPRTNAPFRRFIENRRALNYQNQPFHERSETQQIAGLTVHIWQPLTRPTNAPVIFFSHGFAGCGTQSQFLMQKLADNGYYVFAPDHSDNHCPSTTKKFNAPEQRFREPEKWSDSTFADRGQDLKRLQNALINSSIWRDKLNWSQFILIGHSLGGYTVLASAGAWKSWQLPSAPIAVLALSPYCAPFALSNSLKEISAPIMYQSGSLDLGILPSIKKPDGCFERSPANTSLIEFDSAGHLAWTDLNPKHQQLITEISLKFIEAAIKGQTKQLPSKLQSTAQYKVSFK